MGRTGRKRQGKCVLLMTEYEEQKFKQAKETYEQVQKLITQGVHLSYYKPNPSVIPNNYKPTICRKRIEIGQFKAPEKNKPRGKVASSSFNITLDGFLTKSTEKAFVQSFCNGQEQYTNVTQVMQKYWPTKSIRKSLSKQVPLQTQVKTSHFIGHSKRTLDFVDLIKKIEHRILYPDEEIQFKVSKQQTQLMLPSKVNPSSSKLFLPPKRKPRNDDQNTDLATFYNEYGDLSNEENHFEITNFLNEDEDFVESSTKRNMNDFFIPRKKPKLNSFSKTSDRSLSMGSMDKDRFPDLDDLLDINVDFTKDKGKGVERSKGIDKAIAVNEGKRVEKENVTDKNDSVGKNKTVDKGKTVNRGYNHVESINKDVQIEPVHDNLIHQGMMDTSDLLEDLDDFNIEEDWEPMLPESVYDEVKPINKDSQPSILPQSIEPQNEIMNNDQSPDKSVTILDMDELYNVPTDEEDFDSDNFPLDELISNNLAVWEAVKTTVFDETIPPVFPFETEQCNIVEEITTLWPQIEPNFSKKALELLESRQNSMKKSTGRFLAMKIIAKFDKKCFSLPPASIKKSQTPQVEPWASEITPQPVKTNSTSQILKKSPSPVTISNQTKVPIQVPQVDTQMNETDAPQDIFEIQDDDDDDFGMNDSFLQHAAELADELPIEEVISIAGSQSDIEEGFDSIVYEGGEFAHLFESQNELDEIPDFSFEEQQFVSQKYDYQMKKSAALYGSSSLVSEENKDQYEDPLDSSQPTTLPEIHGSPLRNESTLLQNLAKGLNSPSPLRNSSVFNRISTPLMQVSESEEEDIPLRRKKRTKFSPLQPNIQRTKKRLRQKGSPQEDEDEDGIIMYEGIQSNVPFMERIKRCQNSPSKKRLPKKTNLSENPFFDVEAEKSSDEGHTTEGENEDGGSSFMNSFIDDQNSHLQETIEKTTDVDIYRQNLFEEDIPKKHWMNRFNADKWLNAEEDSIIEEYEEDEQEDNDGSLQELFKDNDLDDDFA